MDDVTELKRKAEDFYRKNNQSLPPTWTWEENQKGNFYIENNTGKKRYGKIHSCKICTRNFLIRNDWIGSVFYCSKFCSSQSREEKIQLNCAWCKKDIQKTKSRMNNSKHGFHFCGRICKEEAQKIGGIEEIQPSHYQDGSKAYSERAFKHYGYKCVDCNVTMKAFLQVHHIDSNRDNGALDNLEVVCNMHHMLRHMRYKKKTNEWVVDFKYLTPRDKLDELRKLLVA
jgi:hypothetical protein